jgi:polyisoprenoid-binding protein YceI
MRKNIISVRNFTLGSMVILLTISAAIIKNTYILSKDYKVTINGTSNLHDWSEAVGMVSGGGSVTWNSDGSFNLDAINLKMDVNSIKSDMGSIMNSNTYKALKGDNNPEIVFALTAPVNSIKPAGVNTVSAKGSLTIAGVTKPVDMQVEISAPVQGKLTFEGSYQINMPDYGIAPPTAFFGTLKTGNKIIISFKTNFTLTAN